MGTTARTHVIRVGNSRGIRIPRLLLEQAGVSGEVQLEAAPGRIVIRPCQRPRQDWDAGFQIMAARGDDLLLDAEAASLSSWDESDWEW